MSRLRLPSTLVVLLSGACSSAGGQESATSAASNLPSGSNSPFLCVGYLPWYRTAGFSADRMHGVTDLIYFGVKPTDDGQFDGQSVDKATLGQLRGLKEASGCRLLLCVGGGDRSQGFAPLAADGARRRTFADELCKFCREHGFDGIDFDWEHPEGDAQLAAYTELLTETKSGLGSSGLVTIAQSPWRNYGKGVYDVVDRVHVMSYNHKFPQARLQASWDDVRRMLDWGCPREKLLLGVPFYGRNQRGESRTYADLAGSRGANADLVEGFALNGRATVRAKTRFALEVGLGGVMVWELGQDARDPETSLLEAIRREVNSRSASSR